MTKAVWIEGSNEWRVTLKQNGKEEMSDFNWFISCKGALHKPMFPDIPGIKDFKGNSWHTTRWPADSKEMLKGKRVGMIGNGASAVQILPHLLDDCEHVVMFQRTAHYCFPRFQKEFGSFFKSMMNGSGENVL